MSTPKNAVVPSHEREPIGHDGSAPREKSWIDAAHAGLARRLEAAPPAFGTGPLVR